MNRLAAALLPLQEKMFLAELEHDRDARRITVTLAGPPGLLMFEIDGVQGVRIAYESLDPTVPPSRLRYSEAPLDDLPWEPEPGLEARLVPLTADGLHDVLSSSKTARCEGDTEGDTVYDLRVESWSLEPDRVDLHVLVTAERLMMIDEEGLEADLDALAAAAPVLPVDLAPESHDGPAARAAFDVPDSPLPPEFEAPLRAFFEAHHERDWVRLASIHPRIDLSSEEQAAWLSRHFLDLWGWGYARAVDDFWVEGDIACVALRGIVHEAPTEEMEASDEECVWSFSLRRRPQGWIVRNWSVGWPRVGGAPELPAAEKPWLSEWSDPAR